MNCNIGKHDELLKMKNFPNSLKGKFGFWGSHLDSILKCLFWYTYCITFHKFSFPVFIRKNETNHLHQEKIRAKYCAKPFSDKYIEKIFDVILDKISNEGN